MSKILVIEDEPAIQKAIAEALRGEGFEIETSFDAEEGLNITKMFRPDLILLDLLLPGKNGFEFMNDLKKEPDIANTPIVILSNLGDEEEIKQGMSLGAKDYLIKADYDLQDVVKIVKKYLEN